MATIPDSLVAGPSDFAAPTRLRSRRVPIGPGHLASHTRIRQTQAKVARSKVPYLDWKEEDPMLGTIGYPQKVTQPDIGRSHGNCRG